MKGYKNLDCPDCKFNLKYMYKRNEFEPTRTLFLCENCKNDPWKVYPRDFNKKIEKLE